MYRPITSRENSIFKQLRKLKRKKYRDRESRYLIEGENLICEALDNEECMEEIILREDVALKFEAIADEASAPVYTLPPELFDDVADTETCQGILAVVKKQIYNIKDMVNLCGAGTNLVVLDRLQDPGNIGTVIRTAEACGYSAVVCMKGTSDPFAPKVVRAAAGSLFRLPVIFVEKPEELVGLVRMLGKRLIVSGMHGKQNYFDVDLSKDVAIVIGNEGNGCSRAVMTEADTVVSIPMRGKLESLNASVAAAVLMYESVRK